MREKWIPASELIRFVCGKKCGCERTDCDEPCEEVRRIEEFAAGSDIMADGMIQMWGKEWDRYYSSKWMCDVITPHDLRGKSVAECLSVNCICTLDTGEKIRMTYPVKHTRDVIVSADKDSMNIGFVSDTVLFTHESD